VRLLLDTCTFLWLGLDSDKLTKAAAIAFLHPDSESFLSAASAWEIAIKYSAGRLSLPRKPEYFIAEEREKIGIATLPIDEEAALLTSRLPRLHNDPFDRMLVAQAMIHDMTIVTPDEAIERYGVRVLW
jgi:PIN domain nuclease of toxin-antitoxin system